MRLTPAKAIDLRWAGIYALALVVFSMVYLQLAVGPTAQGWSYWGEFLVFEVGRVLWVGNTWFALLFYAFARGPALLRRALMLALAGVGAWNALRHYAYYYPQLGAALPAAWGFAVCPDGTGAGCGVWADLHVNLMTTLWAWDALFVFGVVAVWIAVDASASPRSGGRLHWSLPVIALWIAAVAFAGVDTVLPLWLEVLIAAEDRQARRAAAAAATAPKLVALPATASGTDAAGAAAEAKSAEPDAAADDSASEAPSGLLRRASSLQAPSAITAAAGTTESAAPTAAAAGAAAGADAAAWSYDDLIALAYLALAFVGVSLWIPGLYEWSVTRHTIAGQLTDGLVSVSGSRATLIVIGTWAALCLYFLRDVRWAAFDGTCHRALSAHTARAFGLSPAASPVPSPSGSPRASKADPTAAAASDIAESPSAAGTSSRPLRWCVDWSLRLLFLYGLLLHVGAATALALCYRQLTPNRTFVRPFGPAVAASTAAPAGAAPAPAAPIVLS